jgi:hypothetical protein
MPSASPLPPLPPLPYSYIAGVGLSLSSSNAVPSGGHPPSESAARFLGRFTFDDMTHLKTVALPHQQPESETISAQMRAIKDESRSLAREQHAGNERKHDFRRPDAASLVRGERRCLVEMLSRIVTSAYSADSVTTVAFPWSSAAKNVKNPPKARKTLNAAQLNPGSDHSKGNFP